MSTIILTRYAYLPDVTLGKIEHTTDGEIISPVLWTVEREWKFNRRFISCVPPGLYTLVPHNGARFKNTFALTSESNRVYHTQAETERESDRYAIVLHPGSWGDNFQGCVGAGYDRIGDGNRWGVGRTVDGIGYLLQFIRDREIEKLEIKNNIYYSHHAGTY